MKKRRAKKLEKKLSESNNTIDVSLQTQSKAMEKHVQAENAIEYVQVDSEEAPKAWCLKDEISSQKIGEVYELPSGTKLEMHQDAHMPKMQEDERLSLLKSIEKDGIGEPIELREGKIVDGFHRYSVANELQIPLKVKNVEIKDGDVNALKLRKNFIRRSLSSDQKAMIAVLEGLEIEEEAKKRSLANLKQNSESTKNCTLGKNGRTSDRLAKKSDVNRQYIDKAKYINKHSPELVDQVFNGDLKIDAAYKQAKALNNAKNGESSGGKEEVFLSVTQLLQEVVEDNSIENLERLYPRAKGKSKKILGDRINATKNKPLEEKTLEIRNE